MSQGHRMVKRVNRGTEEGPGTTYDKNLLCVWVRGPYLSIVMKLGNISECLITLTTLSNDCFILFLAKSMRVKGKR